MLAFDAAFVAGRTEAQRVASYRRLRAMGVQAIRLDFRWITLEPVGPPLHDYVWAQQDREVRAIRTAGLRVLGILGYGHPDYSIAGGEAYRRGQKPSGPFGVGDPQYYPPDDPRTFARFASDVARRYRSDVIGWEIWNEENGGWRFWEPKEDPLAYGRLLCTAHGALKRVDPEAPVVFGGLFFPPLGGLRWHGRSKVPRTGARRRRPSGPPLFRCRCLSPLPIPVHLARGSGQRSRLGHRRGGSTASGACAATACDATPLWNTEVGWPTNFRGNGVTERQAGALRRAAGAAVLGPRRAVAHLVHVGRRSRSGRTQPGGALRLLPRERNREAGLPGARCAAPRAGRGAAGASWPTGHEHCGCQKGTPASGRASRSSSRGPGGRRLLALWYANERPPSSTSPFAPVEPATPARTITVRLRLRGPGEIVDMLGRRRRVPGAGNGASRVQVGQEPIYVTTKTAPAADRRPELRTRRGHA